jgi:polyhydroxyalkanoate synthase
MDDRQISLADITAPLLALGGSADGIAPVQCVRPIVDLVTGVDDLRFEIVPGGHLGMLTGRAARRTTWRILDEWIAGHSSESAADPTPDAKRSEKKAATRTSRTTIGSNPQRRYGSASSRTLAKK